MKFKYEALDSEGRLTQGVFEAAGEAEALELLRQKGLWPVSLKPATFWRVNLRRGARTADLILFSTQFLRLLEAGLAVDRALKVLKRIFENAGKAEIAQFIELILRDVSSGLELAEALGKHRFFPDYYVNLIRAGQAAGALPRILRELVSYLEERERFRQELLSALLYPAFLLVFGLFAVQTILVYVLPRFGRLFKDLGVTPPFFTRFLIQAGLFWQDFGPYVLLGLVLVFFFLKRRFSGPQGRKALEAYLLRLPLLGRYLLLADLARVCRGLGVMLRGGVPVERALEMAAEVAGLELLRKLFLKANEQVRHGQPLSNVLQELPEEAAFVYDLVAVGEETGDLARAFEDAALLAEEEVRRTTKRFLTVLEPAAILFFGLVLGSMIISILLAIFSLQV